MKKILFIVSMFTSFLLSGVTYAAPGDSLTIQLLAEDQDIETMLSRQKQKICLR